jgi:hypothetical protein
LQLGRRSIGDDDAFIQKNHSISNQVRACEFVRDDNDRHAKCFLQFQNQFVDTGCDNRVKAG